MKKTGFESALDFNSNLESVFLEAMVKVHEDTGRGSEIEGDISPEKYKYFYKICIETYTETLEKKSLNKQVRIGGSLILGTPQERVKLLKAGADGKLIEKLYVDCNNFKIVIAHCLAR